MQGFVEKLSHIILDYSGPTDGIIPHGYDVSDVFLYLGLVLLGAIAISVLRPFAWGARILKIALPLLVIALAVIALLPMITAPLDVGPQVERTIIAAFKPFADWNHPSLQYLVLRPVVSFSLDPSVLKLVPATWVVLASLLIFIEGRHLGGSLGGLLAASWYAAGCRVRMGVLDLGDWDLAVVLLLVLFRIFRKLDTQPKPFGIKATVYFGIVFLLASMSSFLVLIPLGLAVLLLAYKAFKEPAYRPLAIVGALMLAIRGTSALSAFNMGLGGQSTPETMGQLALEMWQQLQPGSNVGGLLFVALGFVAILVSKRTLPMLFLAGSIILVPLGIVTIWTFSIAHGGYYNNIMAGFIALVGAFGIGQIFGLDPTFSKALQKPETSSPSIRENLGKILPFMAGAVFLTLLTVKLPAPDVFGNQSNSSTFEQLIANDELPVVTDLPDMIESVNYYRTIRTDKNLRRNELIHDVVGDGTINPEVFDGVRVWIICPYGSDLNECVPKDQDYYLALRDSGRPIPGESPDTITEVPPTCELALPSSNKARFYKCSAPAPTQ